MEYLNSQLEQKNKEIERLKQELKDKDANVNNLYKILNQIRTAKFFKLWQLCCRFKKNPFIVIKSLKILFKYGPKEFKYRLLNYQQFEIHISDINEQYQIWLKKNWPTPKILKKQTKKQKKFKYHPKISIITPVYNPDKQWLESCINSVINQTYDNWELCLADDNSTKPHVKEILEYFSKKDPRIKVVYRPKNGHISKASNSALKIATGEFVALLDHDDDLAPHALFKIVETLNQNSKLDLIYSDEDRVEIDGQHVNPFFKPDWSPDMLMSLNYICHLSVIRKKIIDQIKGFRTGYEGSQDYDLFLRITEQTKNIYHIPDILYSWRKIPGSTAAVYSVKNYCNQASIKSLTDALDRRNIAGKAENGLVEGTFRTKYQVISNPLVSIIIPTKDKVDYLKRCLDSIFKKTTYQNYELIIIDTNSVEKETYDYYQKIKSNKKITFLTWKKEFNYSAVNNFGAKKAKGDYFLLLNNDTEIITPDWIESMLEHAQRPQTGAVGVKLLYPNNRIQHAGVLIGIGGVANHAMLDYPDSLVQSFPVANSKDIVRNFSAVTAACLMISKTKFFEVNGLNEKFRIAFNDVDFCLNLSQKGYFNVYTPYAKLYHHESISVGKPTDGSRNLIELNQEMERVINKWAEIIKKDPFYNKNLSLKNESFEINIFD